MMMQWSVQGIVQRTKLAVTRANVLENQGPIISYYTFNKTINRYLLLLVLVLHN